MRSKLISLTMIILALYGLVSLSILVYIKISQSSDYIISLTKDTDLIKPFLPPLNKANTSSSPTTPNIILFPDHELSSSSPLPEFPKVTNSPIAPQTTTDASELLKSDKFEETLTQPTTLDLNDSKNFVNSKTDDSKSSKHSLAPDAEEELIQTEKKTIVPKLPVSAEDSAKAKEDFNKQGSSKEQLLDSKAAVNDSLVSISNRIIPSSEPEYYCLRKKPLFTDEDFNKYWNYRSYEPCKAAAGDIITVYENKVEAKCASNRKPTFFFDPGDPEYIHNKRIYPIWNDQPRSVGNSNFVLINCGIRNVYTRVFMKRRPDVVDQARKKRLKQTKPFTVAILLFDSISDFSAKKNLPESWKLLKETKGAYHFEYAKAFPYTTRDNMIPVMYGMSVSQQEKLLEGASLNRPRTHQIYLDVQEKAIWSDYRKLGFITLFGYDSAFEFLAMSLGTTVLTEHKFVNFYKLTNSVYRFTDMTENQRCAGDQGGHKPMLDYALKYYKAYNGELRFGYTHISAAHEETGNIRTVDKDLVQFLRDFFEVYEKNQEDFVLFVMSDHGRMNNLLRFDNRGYLDVFNPMMFIVASEGVGNSTALRKNTERMIGRFDLHLTLKDLAMFPYGGIQDKKYEELKKKYSVKDVVSVFREVIKANRTCEDIGSNSKWCACDEFKPVDFNVKMYNNIVKEIVTAVNAYMNELSQLDEQCEKIIMAKIEKAEFYEIRDYEEGLESVYRIKYSGQDETKIAVEVYFWFDKNDDFLKNFARDSRKPRKSFFIEDKYAQILIWDLQVGGLCGKSQCICKPSRQKSKQ